jgi:asparagine synthase (glutamine-hydrolysing)
MRNHPRFAEFVSDWKKHTGTFVRNPFLKDPELYMKDQSIRDHIYLDSDEFKSYLKAPFNEGFKEEYFTDSLLRNRMLNELFHESTPVILHEDDLNSMFYSIENRSPFLDTRLFNFAYSIPPEHLIQDGYGKYILREAMKGVLNDQVRLDRKKKGFNASVDSFIDFHDKDTVEYLLDPSAKIYEIVDRETIGKLLRDHPSDNSYSKFLFSFINARIFLK